MRFIESRWRAASRLAALVLAALLGAMSLFATAKPRYGGTLRVELLAPAVSLDPRSWQPGAREFADNARLAALIFDRLLSLDNYGRFVPQLAREWSHDAAFHRWQFTLRGAVKFSDGTVLTAADAAQALESLLPEAFQVSGSGNTVVIQSPQAHPDLLEILASGRYFIFRVAQDGSLLGTGPFVLAESLKDAKPAPDGNAALQSVPQRLRFTANESCWAGRPFLDAIDVTLNVPPLRALFDLQAGKAELVELSSEVARRAAQTNTRMWSSVPLTLYGVRFDSNSPQAANETLREALALSLDRASMAGVLLQKQAEPAAALLPQSLSGYGSLFHAEMDADRAKQLRSSLPANIAGGTSPLRVQADVSGDLPRLLAERVAVNARQAGLTVQPLIRSGLARQEKPLEAPDLHLFVWRYASLSPGSELLALASAAHAETPKETNFADPDRRYAWERKILEERKVIPLVVLPDFAALAPSVRDWQPAPWGEWRLADVWLEPANARKNSEHSSGANLNGANP